MGLYFRIREKVRFNPIVNRALYLVQSLYRSNFGRLVKKPRLAKNQLSSSRTQPAVDGVALGLRFRDEARYLAEWIEYHRVAGIEHLFLYDNTSIDNYQSIIEPWIDAGLVTLVDWPRVPASPAAEEDCIRRALGRFAWVGFIDADEFLVIRDGLSIGEFLGEFPHSPGVGLHWRMFGSSGHKTRPLEPVIVAYQRRASRTDQHIKTFLRPERAAQCRNSHSWFYNPLDTAVDEHGKRLYGSIDNSPTSDRAWINHYHCKSEEDYREKAERRSTLDKVGLHFPTRTAGKMVAAMVENNEVVDCAAVDYYRTRCSILGQIPQLIEVPRMNSLDQ